MKRLFILLTSGLLAVQLHGGEPAAPQVPPQWPALNDYEELWTHSLFTSHQLEETALPADPAWASRFSLSGWAKINGKLSVYLHDRESDGAVRLVEGTPNEQYQLTLVELQLGETSEETKAVVTRGSQSAIIAQDEVNTVAPEAAATPAYAAAQLPSATGNAKSIISAPVVFSDSASSITPSAAAAAPSTTMQSPLPASPDAGGVTPPSESAAPVLNPSRRPALQPRREASYGNYPRPATS
jgi:hypothetical protein